MHIRRDDSDVRYVLASLQHLNADEMRGVARLVAKLRAGKEKHGGLDLATDKRDFRLERRAEYEDALWYRIFEEISQS